MSISLVTARTNVRSLLDETTPQFWSNAQINQWLNEGCADAQRRVEWKEKQATLSVVPNTQNYPAPDDVLRLHRVEFNPNPNSGNAQDTYTLEYRGLMEMDQIWGIYQQWPAIYPLYYTLWGQPGIGSLQIKTYPVSAQAGVMYVYYFPNIIQAIADTDNLDIAQGFEDMLNDYCMYRALRRDADPRWQEAKQDYEDKLEQLQGSSRTYQDQAGAFTTGQQSLPYWLTSSDGM